MQQWMTGDERLVRIGPGTGDGAEEMLGCPARDAAEARPGIRVRVPSRLPHEHLETLTLGPVCEALDLIEFEGESLERALDALLERPRPLHPGHLAYAEHAVRLYAGRPDLYGLIPVKPYWVVRKDNGRRWELYASWRRYESADGSVREYRRLRHACARASKPGEIAIAAYAAAFGSSAAWPRRWPREFALRASPSRVTHVRIVETGLADGSRNVQFEGTVDEVRAYYDAFGDAHVRSAVKGGPERPGPFCVDCKQFTGCGAVRRSPGALALPSRKLPLRKVSVGDLRYHALCPAQGFLRSLHLPQSDEYSGAAKLGRAVRGWIEALHRRDGRPARRRTCPLPGRTGRAAGGGCPTRRPNWAAGCSSTTWTPARSSMPLSSSESSPSRSVSSTTPPLRPLSLPSPICSTARTVPGCGGS
ncbi:hypothetical protein [Streptomyces abikoensis]